MRDLRVTFIWRDERVGVLFDFEALYDLEKTHGYIPADLWEQVTKLSAVAQPIALLVGLENYRRKVEQRVRKWTREDAIEMYTELGPREVARILTDAIAKMLVPGSQEKQSDAGKAGAAGAESTGPPSS